MKIRLPLFVKIMAPLVALIILTVGVSGYLVFDQSTRRWQNEMDTRLENIARMVASTVDTDTLKLIQVPTDTDGPAYNQIRQQLDQALYAGNLGWIGLYYRGEGDYLYYWVDVGSSGVGYPFLYATPNHLAAYEDQQIHRVRYMDEYGHYYGFVAPILVTGDDGQTQVLGLVEAVLGGESTQLLQEDTLNRVLPVLIIGSLLAVGLSALIAFLTLTFPLRRLQQGALTLAGGRFGHSIDWQSNDELGDLASTFNQMSAELERLYRERTERERMQRELEIARTVQQTLFPDQLPQVAGLEVAAYCRPHRETSGDFYNVMIVGEEQLGIVVGDVSGKSVPAAMLMVAAHSTIRSKAEDHDSPAVVMNESNVLLCHDVPRGMFVAASYARVDARSGEMVWANAGQIYPFLLNRVRPIEQEYPVYLETVGTALPLGMDQHAHYTNQHLKLLPGDVVLFYTDGIVEAMNPARQLYGFERLEGLVRALPAGLSPQALINTVLTDVAAFSQGAEQHDDITIVAVKLAEEAA